MHDRSDFIIRDLSCTFLTFFAVIITIFKKNVKKNSDFIPMLACM
jgi:hypothetical protein